MKPFYRLPFWIRLFALTALVAICVAINAVAFKEFRRSTQARNVSAPLTLTFEDVDLSPKRFETVTIDSPSSGSPSSGSAPSRSSGTQNNRQNANNSDISILSSRQANSRQADSHQTASRQTASSQKTDSNLPERSDEIIDQEGERQTNISPEFNIEEAKAKLRSSRIDTKVASENATQKYGHFSYTVQDSEDLSLVASYVEGENFRDERLHQDAAIALHQMIASARVNGVWLVPASGFRDLSQQHDLFERQTILKGTPEAAARVSAPPGYSEHHTGYAIDLADGSLSQNNDISPTFAQSPAYAWLSENAKTFGFELSFPKNNKQGIAFEPWHWRYIGTQEAQQTFSNLSAAQPRETLPGKQEKTQEQVSQ